MKNRNMVKQDFQLVNAKYKLDTSEIKFIMTALAQINADDKEFCTYEIKISELEAKLQVEQNSTRLKQFAKKLMSKPLEVPTEGGGWIVFNWFSKIQFVPKERKFIVRIDNDLKPYLLELRERFITCNLKYILPLTSSYSVRIYQMLKEYEKLKIRYLKVDELMETLQVPSSLKIYANFKNKVLKIAEKELLEHTDIFFTLEEEKEGKKVDRLIFRIYPNKQHTNKEENLLLDSQLDESLKQYINKKIYFNGYSWKIISIAQNENQYTIFVHEIDDVSYTKTFEISEAQLKTSV
jgi:plasmid replication initiation protein